MLRGHDLKLTEDPHRRLNALTNEWVLVSPHRATRPWQGEVAKLPTASEPAYDPSCYLCPGNSRVGGVRNPVYRTTFVFENDFAALKPQVAHARLDVESMGLLVAESEPGVCRVICFSPRHDLTLATMGVEEIEQVVRTWIGQFRELSGLEEIPQEPAKELIAQRAYQSSHNTCLLCDYVALEQRQQVRVVSENDGFVALIPFWAVWPFEILVCSRRHFGSMNELATDEVSALSDILHRVTSTYDKVFGVPFPYSMGFHQSPSDGVEHPEWHFHAHFFPPLLRSATIRKFMVGFEMLGTPQRDITPESAAERLRQLAQQ